jgi:hypothetical protein
MQRNGLLFVFIAWFALSWAQGAEQLWSGASDTSLDGRSKVEGGRAPVVLTLTAEGKQPLVLDSVTVRGEGLSQYVVSPDGTKVAYLWSKAPVVFKTLRKGQDFDYEKGERLEEKTAAGDMISSPGGPGAVEVRILDLAARKKSAVFKAEFASPAKELSVSSVCFSPDGRRLCMLATKEGQTILHIGTVDSSELKAIPLAQCAARAVPMPNSQDVLFASRQNNEESIGFLKTGTGEITVMAKHGNKNISHLVVSPCGKHAAYLVQAVHEPTGAIMDLALPVDGKTSAPRQVAISVEDKDMLSPLGFTTVAGKLSLVCLEYRMKSEGMTTGVKTIDLGPAK